MGKAQEVPYAKLSPRKGGCTCKLAMLIILVILLVFTATIFLFVGIGGACCFPLHASCKVDWTIGKSCSDVSQSLVDQIHKWQGPDNCKDGGQRCLYVLKSSSPGFLKATHETPQKHYIDDLTFTFTEAGNKCQIHGFSTSETWYALLDYGTNYCNLHNLITGAGLDKTPGYVEATTDKQCTQFSSANCDVY